MAINELHIPAPSPKEGVAYRLRLSALHIYSNKQLLESNMTESERTGVQPYVGVKCTESGTKQRDVIELARAD